MNLSSFGHDLNITIIGASGGVGHALVEQLSRLDQVAKIYALSRSDTTFDSDKVTPLSIDIADEETIKKAVSNMNDAELDIVIIATGLLHDDDLQPEKNLNDLAMDKFMDIYRVNTFGPALVIKHFAPFLPRDRKSVIAAISARVGSIGDNRMGGWYAYRSSKSALNMLLKNASIELGRKYKQTSIIGLHPGTVDTGLSKPFQGHVPEGKLFTPTQSADYLINVIDQVGADDTGGVFAWDGVRIEN